MAAQVEPEIALYDLACTKGVCFSPAVWRVRLMLNYKRIPYKTIFIEFPDIEPTLKGLGIHLAESSTGSKYTVPAIYHIPTNTYTMDSTLIAQFLEATYPDRPISLTSELGREIESKSRTVIGPIFRDSVMPHEVKILSPRSQEYFRRTREAAFGCKLEELLYSEKEESAWREVEDDIRAVEQLLLTNEKEGQFVLGARPSATDFFLAGSLHAARMVDESVFARIAKYPGYRKIYEACVPYMKGQEVPDITD
ncbi:hypothetical protein AA0111_g8165 [Alternaria arborescens]|uniref:hypothetical protein n=1 Tax=Alternaria arborescens TaxID=156630 RepID=UPI0010756742|nr:hypothetical protein AA0111_g8165 [Alternaria arborescens]RYO26281.1 hypothetical protein AA0111_g8165 [Alternaria arborescens]